VDRLEAFQIERFANFPIARELLARAPRFDLFRLTKVAKLAGLNSDRSGGHGHVLRNLVEFLG
jgi:hypothetical protein